MESTTSLWEMLLTWVMLGGMLGGAIAASLWARRRRRRGDEAGTSNAEGAEVLIEWPGPS